MTTGRSRVASLVLQWALGLVILVQASSFAFSPAEAHSFAKTGMPNFIRIALAWCEMAAAILFLMPRTLALGGWSLITVLALAATIHVLHGWWDVGGLVVYAVATWSVMASRAQTSEGIDGCVERRDHC